MGHLLGHATVSTGDQRLDLQLDAVKVAGRQRVWSDTAPESVTERPELAQILDHLRPGDTLVVCRGHTLQEIAGVIGVGRSTLVRHPAGRQGSRAPGFARS